MAWLRSRSRYFREPPVWTPFFLARFFDLVGKSIRGAPRDALIGELAPPNLRATCYGLRQSLDTVGPFIGPLMAMGFMVLFVNDIRAVLWVAVIPAVLGVVLLMVGVQEPPSPHPEEGPRRSIRLVICRGLVPPTGGLCCSEAC